MTDRERTYLDFDLEVGIGEGGRLLAQVCDSPAGQAEHSFVMPLDALELENFVLRVGRTRSGRRRVGSPQYRLAQEVGTKLYDALFAGEVRIAFRRSLDRAKDQGKGLRVRLRFDEAPGLAQVPWEYLYAPGVGDFLVLSSRTPLVRHLDLPHADERLAIEPPLQVLVAVASPSDLERLDADREVELVRRAVGDLAARGSVEVTQVPSGRVQDLRRTLRRGTYHVLHFVGHGGWDEQHQDGVLAFEDDHGLSRHVAGQQLGTLLHDHPSLRLVVLNACEGARTSTEDPFAGVAQSLLRRGVPAAVAMQFEITDEAAIAFSHELYLALVEGEPIEAAVAEARLEIFSSDNDIEWGTPVLYSRARDGRLFDLPQGGVADDAPPITATSDLPPPPPRTTPPTPPVVVLPELDHAPSVPIDGSTASLHTSSTVGDDAATAAPTAGREDGDGPASATARTRPEEAPSTSPASLPETQDRTAGSADDDTSAVATNVPGVLDLRDAPPGVAGAGVGHPPPPLPGSPSRPASSSPAGDGTHRVGRDGGVRASMTGLVRPAPASRLGGWLRRGALTVAVLFGALVAIGLVVEEPEDDPPVEPTTGPSETAQPPVDAGPTTFEAPRVRGEPLVDAAIDEFGVDRPGLTATAVVAGEDVGLQASFAMAWDEDAFQVLGFVSDPVLASPYVDRPSRLFRGDAIHFELGPDPRDLGVDGGLRERDVHVLAGPVLDADGAVVGGVAAVNASSGGVFVEDTGLGADVVVDAVAFGDGYLVEVAVPWDLVGVDPEPGVVVGINLNASDVDAGELFSMVSTNPDRSGAHQVLPGTWQTVELVEVLAPG